ncbi:hypothetical protein QJS66_12415 [Kocuria rhizophila]|nr:hypothetical protein QJS66_12415 [Kocuria rhizophila]
MVKPRPTADLVAAGTDPLSDAVRWHCADRWCCTRARPWSCGDGGRATVSVPRSTGQAGPCGQEPPPTTTTPRHLPLRLRPAPSQGWRRSVSWSGPRAVHVRPRRTADRQAPGPAGSADLTSSPGRP